LYTMNNSNTIESSYLRASILLFIVTLRLLAFQSSFRSLVDLLSDLVD
jgi:hypothetical protein